MTATLRFALFDLDNTLYPQSSGVMAEIGRRMNRFMQERLGIPENQVRRQRDALLVSHGTTLNGLRRQYAIDPDEFLKFVHDLPLERLLQPDAELDRMLTELPLRKVVFTNADAAHARRVLTRLGVLRQFEFIIDIHLLEFCNKPDPRAYWRALEIIDARPDECVLAEDYPANVRTAKELGMTTVLVAASGDASGPKPAMATDAADYTITRVADFIKLPFIHVK